MATTTVTQNDDGNSKPRRGRQSACRQAQAAAQAHLDGGGRPCRFRCSRWGGYYFFSGKKEGATAAAGQVKPPVFLDMPEVLVNLSTPAAAIARNI